MFSYTSPHREKTATALKTSCLSSMPQLAKPSLTFDGGLLFGIFIDLIWPKSRPILNQTAFVIDDLDEWQLLNVIFGLQTLDFMLTPLTFTLIFCAYINGVTFISIAIISILIRVTQAIKPLSCHFTSRAVWFGVQNSMCFH